MEELIKSARAVLQHSYSPFSKFPVGAAVLDEQGRIHTGVNVENSSYGLTQCAETEAQAEFHIDKLLPAAFVLDND